MSPPVIAQLLTLAAFRRLELAQAIRLARMQLPADSPAIGALVAEQKVNEAAIADLESRQRAAA